MAVCNDIMKLKQYHNIYSQLSSIHIYTHTTVITPAPNSLHGYRYTATPSVDILMVYKCTFVHITPDLMIILLRHSNFN